MWRSLAQRLRHFPDRGLATSLLGDLLILAAFAGGNLADQSEVATLKLSRGQLLGRDGTATTPASRCGLLRRACRCWWTATAATHRTSATRAGLTARRTRCALSARCRSQRGEPLFELADLMVHFTEVPIDLSERDAALAQHPIHHIRSLSGIQLGRCLGTWSSQRGTSLSEDNCLLNFDGSSFPGGHKTHGHKEIAQKQSRRLCSLRDWWN